MPDPAPRTQKPVRLAQAAAVVMAPARAAPRKVYSEGIYLVTRRAAGLAYLKGIMAGAPVHVVKADLRAPNVKVGIAVARGGIGRRESFQSLLNRTVPAASITGTFFGLRNGLPTGDIVVNGRAIYRGFIGTALAITDGNVVSFIATSYNEDTNWALFDTVVRGGPRLVTSGEMAVNPLEEGFRTLAGDAYRPRTAVGITPERKLLLVTVKKGITLRRLAMAMRALGAYHAVALDGGASTAASFGGRIIAQPSRALTNLLVVYADRDRYERSRKHFYYHARRRVLPSGPPSFDVEFLNQQMPGPAAPGVPAPVAPPQPRPEASAVGERQGGAIAGSLVGKAAEAVAEAAEEPREEVAAEEEAVKETAPAGDTETTTDEPSAGEVPAAGCACLSP
jgi:hypothetical protein